MKILVLNGPNINMLGVREKNIYGDKNYPALIDFIKKSAAEINVKVKCAQTNSEGRMVGIIQKAYRRFDAIVINPAAYTHTSVAVLDALKAVNIPTVEVHISDIASREDFRKFSYVSLYAEKTIAGKGFGGYAEALAYLKEQYS